MAAVTFRILGPLQAFVDGEEVSLGGPKPRGIAAFLLLNANHVVSADELVEAIWAGEGSERVKASLQVHVSNLRKSLAGGREVISSVASGYRMSLEPDELDVLEFGHRIARADHLRRTTDDLDSAVSYLRGALDLWRGPLLADLADFDFVRDHATRLEEQRSAAASELAEMELQRGHHVEVIGELQREVRSRPFDERLRGLLMLALYRAGRQADALAACKEGREILRDELGVEPGPALADLEMKILDHHPSLQLGAGQVVRPQDRAGEGSERMSSRMTAGRLTTAELHVEGLDTPLSLHRAVTTVGRKAECVVVLQDMAVSRLHAEIRREDDGFVLADRGSTHGTHLNGELVSRALLVDGDVIQLGGTTMVFRRRGGG